jgi:DNA-binding SARP family transcriptional activator
VFRLITLGGLVVHPDADPSARPVTQRRRLAVLALLAASERGISREKLLGYLWPDTEEERGRRLLNQAVYGLRQDLTTEAIVGTADLRLSPGIVSCDLTEYHEAVASGDGERAAGLYGGPFLDGFYLPGAAEFDRWVEEERGALARQQGELLERLARGADARRDIRASVTWWGKLAAHDPLSSAAALGLMQAYAAAGDREAALRHARVHETMVAEELGAPASREVLALAERLREQPAPAAVPAPSAAASPSVAPAPADVTPAPAPADAPDIESLLRSALSPDLVLGPRLQDGAVQVYLAEDVELGRKVLVKALSRHLSFGLSAPRFERGIRLAAQLQHPHIVPVLGAGNAGGVPYYVAPYVEGESLAERVKRLGGTMPVGDAIRILSHVASALAYAHRRGVIHRDVKPENVLVSGDYALISEFGVAKALLDSARGADAVMSVGLAIGTPGYMAPEQARGDPATDHRADIYAFGVLARALLSREAPAPPHVHGLIERCLAGRPSDRPQSAEELHQTLTQPAPAGYRGWTRRHSVIASVLAAALLAIGVLLLSG